MKLKELRELPSRKWDEVKIYDSLYVIPSGKKHESGFALMYIVGINGDEKEIAAACDDIVWDATAAGEYSLRNDMLYPSGILHYWSNVYKFKVGASLSSTDIELVI